jgi:hypothetical protein
MVGISHPDRHPVSQYFEVLPLGFSPKECEALAFSRVFVTFAPKITHAFRTTPPSTFAQEAQAPIDR